LFFAIYSFAGWLLESIFATFYYRKIVNRGFLSGFFCPIYGFGSLLIIYSAELISRLISDHITALVASILFSVLLVTVLEYITGYILEKIFNCKWWDYSRNFANIHGYICLQYSLLWGILAFLLVRFGHPLVSKLVFSIDQPVRIWIAAIFAAGFGADTIKTIINALDLRKVILNYANLPIQNYHEKIIQYKRFFHAFPRLLRLNADTINHDIRSILNDRLNKIKVELKSKIQ
jgi:uncharacterized membrane protein